MSPKIIGNRNDSLFFTNLGFEIFSDQMFMRWIFENELYRQTIGLLYIIKWGVLSRTDNLDESRNVNDCLQAPNQT